MEDAQVVVIGANGQLGRAFQKSFPGANFLAHKDFDLEWSMSNQLELLTLLRPRLVLNCAAYNDVDGAENDSLSADATNGYGVRALADACLALDADLVTYSSDYVFDGVPVEGGYTEEYPARPLSAYGRSKLLGEGLVSQHANAMVVRTSWVFGESPRTNFVDLMLNLADQGRTEVTVTDDLLSRPTYAPDLATATLALLDLGDLRPKLVHVANEGEPTSKAGQAEAVFELAGREVAVRCVTTAEYDAGKTGLAQRPHFSVFNLDLMHSCGIHLPTWREALATYLQP